MREKSKDSPAKSAYESYIKDIESGEYFPWDSLSPEQHKRWYKIAEAVIKQVHKEAAVANWNKHEA